MYLFSKWQAFTTTLPLLRASRERMFYIMTPLPPSQKNSAHSKWSGLDCMSPFCCLLGDSFWSKSTCFCRHCVLVFPTIPCNMPWDWDVDFVILAKVLPNITPRYFICCFDENILIWCFLKLNGPGKLKSYTIFMWNNQRNYPKLEIYLSAFHGSLYAKATRKSQYW